MEKLVHPSTSFERELATTALPTFLKVMYLARQKLSSFLSKMQSFSTDLPIDYKEIKERLSQIRFEKYYKGETYPGTMILWH